MQLERKDYYFELPPPAAVRAHHTASPDAPVQLVGPLEEPIDDAKVPGGSWRRPGDR